VTLLDWQGCLNVRDLGGLPTADGGTTRMGALVRADAPDRLTPAGWQALRDYGIRTIVDLRNDDELGPAPPDAGLSRLHLPLDGVDEDPGFWDTWGGGPQFGTPLYYRPHLERFPERSARVIAAVASAEPGGVLFHCVGGRDRTGQIAMLLLALCGVAPGEIAADYERSGPPAPEVDAFLRERGTSAAELIETTLAELDVESCLGAAGLGEEDLLRLRRRLVA
jgi:protein tyrosine/serine phosphatase